MTATRYFGKCAFVVTDVDGRQVRCNHRIVIETAGQPMAECTKRGHYWQLDFKAVKATTVPHITCDAKCHEAVSEICKCSCGGANHGQLPARKI